jgi:glutathione reductase (NADPH)
MAKYDYDLLVIGAGSGGVRAARMSAGYGARVAIVEERYLGGTCVNVGCVPKKLLVYGAHVREELEDAAGFGWSVPPAAFDWPTLVRNKNAEIARLNGVYESLLTGAGVRIVDGHGVLADAHTVEVGPQRFTAERILVSTGSWPFKPDVPGAEHAITSNEAFYLERLPDRVLIGGGGYIAVEFAGILNGLGSRVTQLYRGPLFLRGFDDDARAFLAGEMRKKGIELRFNANFKRLEKLPGGAVRATLSDGSTLETDLVLCAMGRVPNTAGLGLAELGVKMSGRGALAVDEHYQTSVPSIYGLGDVIDRVQLTPVAIAEAMVLARHLFGGGAAPLNYANIPSTVFSQPSLGTVGLTEAQAAQQHRVQVFVSEFRPMKHTLSGRDERTLMKLVVDADSDRVLGCHMVGPEAGEIIQGLAIALTCGATKAQFDATVGIHPTAAEEWVTMCTPRAPAARAAAGD